MIVSTLPRALVDSVAEQIPGDHALYDVDYDRTIAFVHGAGNCYINDAERFEDGVVDPSQIPAIKDELTDLFESVTDDDGNGCSTCSTATNCSRPTTARRISSPTGVGSTRHATHSPASQLVTPERTPRVIGKRGSFSAVDRRSTPAQRFAVHASSTSPRRCSTASANPSRKRRRTGVVRCVRGGEYACKDQSPANRRLTDGPRRGRRRRLHRR